MKEKKFNYAVIDGNNIKVFQKEEDEIVPDIFFNFYEHTMLEKVKLKIYEDFVVISGYKRLYFDNCNGESKNIKDDLVDFKCFKLERGFFGLGSEIMVRERFFYLEKKNFYIQKFTDYNIEFFDDESIKDTEE